jgi:hypothetical protein
VVDSQAAQQPNPEPIDDESLTVKKAAEFLGLSASHLNRLRSLGGGPDYFRTPGGHRVMYTRPLLRKWRDQFKISSNAGEGGAA